MMRKETCHICRHVPRPIAIEPHHIIPTQVTEQAEIPESITVNLCHNCHREVHTWYSMKVLDTTYDLATKRFKTKPWNERAKDYESAFKNFKKYKKPLRQTGQEAR